MEIRNENLNISHRIDGILFVTGPLVMHEQISDPQNPIYEDCLYIQMEHTALPKDTVASRFAAVSCWYGQDRERLSLEFEKIFRELRERRIGYKNQVGSMLEQCIVNLVRNYSKELFKQQDKHPIAADHPLDYKNFITEVRLLVTVQPRTLHLLQSP